MEQRQKDQREQRAEKSTKVIANSFKAESFPPTALIGRGCDEGVARCRARPRSQSVEGACAEDARPARGEADQGLGERSYGIADQRNWFAPLELVRKPPGKPLHDILNGLGDALHETHDARTRSQRLG